MEEFERIASAFARKQFGTTAMMPPRMVEVRVTAAAKTCCRYCFCFFLTFAAVRVYGHGGGALLRWLLLACCWNCFCVFMAFAAALLG